jgi:hypothetical protein
MKEQNIQAQIMLALSKAGCIVWRNNTGALTDKTGRLVRYGLCKGSSDIIGICPDGKFLAVEVKTEKGRLTECQERFINAVKSSGGRAGVARSVDDVFGILEG